MMRKSEMDEFIERKIGNRNGMSVIDMNLETDEEYFLFVNAAIRMIDKDARDCPFRLVLIGTPLEVVSGKYIIPNGTIERKRIYMIHDDSDMRLLGNKMRLYDRETGRML